MWNKLLIIFLFISGFAEGQFLQRSNAPKDSLIQHAFDKRGRKVYQDTSGINMQNVWFAPDNGQGKKHRAIQNGKYFNLTGVEWVDVGPASNVGNDFKISGYLKKRQLGVSAQIFGYGDANLGGIRLRFLSATDKLELRIKTDNYFTSSISSITVFTNIDEILFLEIINNSTDGFIIKINGNVEITQAYATWDVVPLLLPITIGASTAGGSFSSFGMKWMWDWRIAKGVNEYAILYFDDTSGLIAYDALTINGNNGTITLGGSSESSFFVTSSEIPSFQNDLGYWFSGDAIGVGSLTPIALDEKGNIDILGNTVLKSFHGPVRYETSIEPTLLVPDGIIKLTHPDLSGITITSSQGTSTPSKSGNDILLTSGNIRELILSNDDRYQFSEFTGDTIFNTVNSDHLLIDLNGSAINPFGNDTSAYPYNQLNGYWSNPSDTVKAPIETDFYNTFIPGSSKVINNSGDVYDRNFADAPALEAANVHVDENITYDSITADFTKFYRNTETGIVRDLIVNSNFPEPISGSSNLKSRIENYIQRDFSGNAYDFHGNEKITIPDVPAFERTSTFYLRANISNKVGGIGDIFRIWNNRTGSLGLDIFLFNDGSGEKVNITLTNTDFTNEIVVGTGSEFPAGVKKKLEIWYNGSSNASGVTMEIDDVPISLTIFTDNLSASIDTGDGFAIGKVRDQTIDAGEGAILDDLYWEVDATAQFETNCNDNGDLTCVDLSGQDNNGSIDIDITPREQFFINQ